MTTSTNSEVESNSEDIRVMVVDDSAVTRWLVQSIVDGQDGMRVAGSAHNGIQAIERIDNIKPDIVLLDVEMPEMDGIETLKAIRKKYQDLPVVMFSTLTEKSASVTLEALALGATDYVTKPHKEGGREAATEAVTSRLVPLIRTLARPSHLKVNYAPRPQVQPVRASSPSTSGPTTRTLKINRIDAVVIGSSTGGPNALAEVIPLFPQDLSVPVLVVQHMPPVFTQMLADRLDTKSHLRVVEVSSGMRVKSGSVYIAAGGIHMGVKRIGAEIFATALDDPPEHSVKPAVDVLLRSAISVWGGAVLSVILTGMGEDGLAGSTKLVETGGTVVVQDSASSLVWGMPGAVAKAGLASEILPLGEIAGAITRLVQAGSRKSLRA